MAAALPWIAAGALTLGGIKGSKAARERGEAEERSAMYQAEVARRNALNARKAAEHAIAAGKQQEALRRLQGSETLEHNKVAFAAGNLDVASGTPNRILRDVGFMTELDALTIRSNTARTAWGFLTQAEGFESSAPMYEMQGQYAKRAAKSDAASSILSAAGSVASMFLIGGKTGLFGSTGGGSATGSFMDAGSMPIMPNLA